MKKNIFKTNTMEQNSFLQRNYHKNDKVTQPYFLKIQLPESDKVKIASILISKIDNLYEVKKKNQLKF